MGLDALVDLYNPLSKTDKDQTSKDIHLLSSWKDSLAVVRLSDYLKEHKKYGMKLYSTDDDKPSLCFEPGLTREDIARWQIATEASRLLLEASNDLYQLIDHGLLILPKHKSERVLPGGSCRYGNSNRSEERRVGKECRL